MAQKGELRVRVTAEDKASGVLKKVTGGVIALAGAYLSIRGIQQIIGLVGSFTREAMVQEKALAKLTQQLKNHGELTQDNIDALTNQANALQKVTAFADDQIIAGQAMLASFGLTTEQLKAMTPRMLDVAVMTENTTGQMADLATVAKMVGVALSGQVGQLTRMGIKLTDTQKELWKTSDATEKFNLLLEIFDENAAGLAETIGKTFQGQLIRNKNLIGDLKETIGEAITKNEAWKAILEFTNNKLSDLNKWLKENEAAVKEWATTAAEYFINFGDFAVNVILDIATAVSDLSAQFLKLGEMQYKAIQMFSVGPQKKLAKERLKEIQDLREGFEKVSSTALLAKYHIGELSAELRDFVNAAIREGTPSINSMAGAFAGPQGGVGAGGGHSVASAMDYVKQQLMSFGPFVEEFMQHTVESVTLITDEMKTKALEVQEFWRVVMHDYVQSFTSSFIDSIFEARKAFMDYVKDFLVGITKMIVKMIAFRAISSAFGFPLGGMGIIPGMQHGGIVPGGGPYTDRVPALLTPGEYVLPRDVVKAMGGASGVQRAITNNFSPTVNVNVPAGSDGRAISDTIEKELFKMYNRGKLNFMK